MGRRLGNCVYHVDMTNWAQEAIAGVAPLPRTTMRSLQRPAQRLLRPLDALATRLYGWRANPLHQSGTIAAALLAALILSGLYLLLFYRVSAPWASVARIHQDPWIGRWMRALHRFASDAMVVAVLVHAWRMFAQERSWGPRALAWTSGVVLLAIVFASGWTGYVMVWDTFGAKLATAGARLFDVLPVLSEPSRRIFAGDRPIPPAFFFLNLFLHVALPLGVAAGLWLHVSRLARPVLLPPRPLLVGVIGVLALLAIALPAPLLPEASPFALPAQVPSDLFYAFWLPWADRLSPAAAWAGALLTFALALLVPRFTRRPRVLLWAPSVVDERLCTGCNQCPQDCPWDAITMHPRSDGRPTLVARVDPARCVSCGICAGSCAPMGVGPDGRTGRDQLAALRRDLAGAQVAVPPRPLAICCENAAPEQLGVVAAHGLEVRRVSCAGNLHTSVVELALREGAPGVIVLTCPPRDCRGREGTKWLHERMYNDREAELQPRVDRQRIEVAVMASGDVAGTTRSLDAFLRRIESLRPAGDDGDDVEEAICTAIPLQPNQRRT